MSFLNSIFKSKKAIVISAISLLLVVSITATALLGGFDFLFPSQDKLKPYAKEKIWDQIFEDESKGSFQFFWDNANNNKNSKGYGLMVDRVTNPKMASIASVGFALSAYGIGVENKWITKEQGYERTLGTLKTLLNNTSNVNGVFYHFVNMETGVNTPGSEVSIIDTALCINGVLFAGEYFGGEAKQLADQIYQRVQWNWYVNPETDQYYMGYNKTDGFSGAWNGYAEQLQMYFLGAASPTYPIQEKTFYDFKRQTSSHAGFPQYVSCTNGDPLFTYQFSHAFFDLQNKQDKNLTDWYYNSVLASLVNRQFCIDNSNLVKTYGKNSWGLTPSDVPTGYGIYGASVKHQIDGTVPVCGPAGSAPMVPEEVRDTLKNFKTHDKLWNEKYGFYDSYNLSVGDPWYAKDMLGIDKGISLVMIENLRSGLVWKYMNKNQYVTKGMKKCGINNAASYTIDDGDTSKSGSGLQGDVKAVAGSEESGYETSFASPLKATLDLFEPEALNMEMIRMDVKGKATISAKVTDESGAVIAKVDGKPVNSADKFTSVEFNLKSVADEKIVTAKNVEFSAKDVSGNVVIDEVEFSTASDIARNVLINERPYVDQTIHPVFDFYSPHGNKQPKFIYQWYTSDSPEGTYKKIKSATQPTYKVKDSDVGNFIRVEVAPAKDDGTALSEPTLSPATSIVTKDKPKDVIFVQRQIAAMINVKPDSTSGDKFDIINKWKDGPDGVYDIVYNEGENEFDTSFDKGNTDWSYMYRDFLVSDLSKYNRLDITVGGNATILIKMESKTKTPIEIKLFLTEEGTYQWDLSKNKELLSDVSKILIFASPGQTMAKGEFGMRKLEFNVAPASGDNVIKTGGTNAPINKYNGKDAEFDINKLWQDFGDGVYTITPNVDKTTHVDYDKPAKATWPMMFSSIGGDLSKFKKVVFEIKGEKGKKILCKVEGTQPKSLSQVMVFADPGVGGTTGEFDIKRAFFSKDAYTGSGQVHKYTGGGADFDFNGGWASQDPNQYTFSGKTTINYNIPRSILTKKKAPVVTSTVAAPVSAAETGIYTFSGGVDRIEIDLTAVYAAKAATTTPATTTDSNAKVYEPDNKYAFAYTNVAGNFSDFKFVSFQVQGPAGQKALLKVSYGSQWFEGFETTVIFNGSVQTAFIDLKNATNGKGERITPSMANRINKIMLIAEPGSENAKKGQMKMVSAKFTNDGKAVPINVYKGGGADFYFNKFWQGNDSFYKCSSNGTVTTINYKTPSTKALQFGSYAFVPIQGNFSDFNYIVLKVQGTKGKQAVFKVEYGQYGKAGYECAPNSDKGDLDVHTFTGRDDDYVVIDISKMSAKARNSLTKLIMFAEPDKLSVTGTIKIFDAKFTDTLPAGAKPPVRIVNIYGNYPYDFNVNKNWGLIANGSPLTVSTSGGITTVKYDIPKSTERDAEGNLLSQYVGVNSLINGQGKLNTLRYLEVDVKGPAGQEVMVKVVGDFDGDGTIEWFEGLEEKIILDGTNQPVVIDLKDKKTPGATDVGGPGEHLLTAAEINKLSQVQVFPAPGTTAAASGTLTISKAVFTNTDPMTSFYTGPGGTTPFNCNEKWIGDSIYTFTNVNGGVRVKYNKPNNKPGEPEDTYYYSSAYKKIDGNFSDFAGIEFEVTGPAGKQATFKVSYGDQWYEGIEQKITFTGSRQPVSINFAKDPTNVNGPDSHIITKAEKDNLNKIVIMAEPEIDNVSGQFIIHKTYFTNKLSTINYYTSGDPFHFNKLWNSDKIAPTAFKFTNVNGGVRVNYNKGSGQEYLWAYTNVQGNLSDFNYLQAKISATAGQKFIVKAQGDFDGDGTIEWFEGVEAELILGETGTAEIATINFSSKKAPNGTADGGPAEHYLTSAEKNKISEIVIMPQAGSNNVSGQFVIEDILYTNSPLDDGSSTYLGDGADFNFNRKWATVAPAIYTIGKNGTNPVIGFNIPSGEYSWGNYAYVQFDGIGKLSDFNYIILEVKGTAGKKAVFKADPSDAAQKDHVFTGNVDKVVIQLNTSSVDVRNKLSELKIYAGLDPNMAGNIEIISAKFTKNP